MLLGGGRLLHIDVTVHVWSHAVGSSLRLESWINILVGLVHILSQVSGRFGLVEVERLRDCRCLRLFELLHFGHKLLLDFSKIGHTAGSWWGK